MNWPHLRAFIWLRWRLVVNRLRRGGTLNAVLALLLVIVGVFCSGALIVIFFLVGLLGLADVEPAVLMFVWDGLVFAFLFTWTSGTLVELQRADVLSLDKFLHLPVSPAAAFLLNYFSSLFCFSMMFFLPSMLALTLGLIASRGVALALVLPALGAFLLMVTALTYQFQGWLASLMMNKRRRRTVLVLLTMVFVLLCQVPNLLNLYAPWTTQKQDPSSIQLHGKLDDLKKSFDSGEITAQEYHEREQELRREFETTRLESEERTLRRIEETLRFANHVLPVGWLPLGAEASSRGNAVPALLGTLGMAFIGTVSLWRSYRTTVRLYTGHFSSGARGAVVAAAPKAPRPPATNLLEWRLPFVSEQAAVVALGGLRSLLRAPEMKLAFLSQVILVAIFASTTLMRLTNPPELVRPLLAAGGMTIALFGMSQVIGNQFGCARTGFRTFVLSAGPRREILLGKNLGVAPVPLVFAAIALIVVQVRFPMRIDHFVAVVPQMLTMYLLFCMLANWVSLLAPMRLRSGSLRATNPRMLAILIQLGYVLLFPWVLAPSFAPLAAEFVLAELFGISQVPAYLILTILELVVVGLIYRLMLNLQGRVLQASEMRILERVAIRDE